MSSCPINLDDSLATCIATGSGFATPNAVAVAMGHAFVTNTSGNSVSVCTMGAGGTLLACSAMNGGFIAPKNIAVNTAATFAYVQHSTGESVCAISSIDGSLSGCVSVSGTPLNGIALSADGSHAYGVAGPGIDLCDIAGDGTFTNCTTTGTNSATATVALAIEHGYLYATSSDGALVVCPINGDASLGACQETAIGLQAIGIAASGASVYLSTGTNSVLVCPIHAGGLLGSCQQFNDPSLLGASGLSVH